MATVTTTTNANPLIWPSTTLIDRDPRNGHLYVMVKATTANTFELWRSTNGGGAWALFASMVRANVQEIGSIFVDNIGYLHWAFRTNESSQDRIVYRRFDIALAAWSGDVVTGTPGNGGVAGAIHTGVEIHVVVAGSSGWFIAIACGTTQGASIGVTLYGVTINQNGFAYNNSIFAGGIRQWLNTGAGRITPSLDIEHGGDGKGSNVPHLWLAWGRTDVYMVRCAWNGSGWSAPPSSVKLNPATLTAQDSIPARWDGQRFMVAVPNPTSASTVITYERNRANSSTQVRSTPVHPAGVIRSCSLSYNAVNGDLRVYAVGTGNADLHFVDYVRASSTWTAWSTVSLTDIIGAPPNNYTIRRSSVGSARYDVLMAHSTPTPNTLVHLAQTLSYAPNVPVWDTASMGVNSGGAADVAAARLLDWTFSDPDPTDTQSAYALSRQIGAGALSYWRASDSTWQVAEVKNVSATSSVTLASGWAVATDAQYTYKVKVWDSADVVSLYSDGFTVIPSAKANPTIATPTAAAVLATDTVTPTWTVSEQSAYRLTLASNPGGVVAYDSGWVASSALTAQVPVVLADLTGWTLTLQTRNIEGLPSNVASVNFTIDYLEPPAPAIVATPQPTSGTISVAISNLAAVGAQPALASQELWRRPVVYTNMLTNPGFEVDMSTWSPAGATAVRSTAQAHSGAASAFVTPDGVILTPRIDLAVAFMADVVAGDAYIAEGWLRPTTANKPVRVGVNWYTAGAVYVDTSLIDVPSLAGAWMFVTLLAVVPATSAKASPHFGLTNTPAVGDTLFVDDVRFRKLDTSAGVRVAVGLSGGATVADWGAAHGVAYEYRAVARGVNGTSIAGPWTA